MSNITCTQVQSLREAISAVVRTFKVADGHGVEGQLKLNQPDLQALLFVSQHDRCIAGDVAGFLGVVATTSSAIIDRLVRRGLVIRNRTEENRRIVQLTLSADGEKTVGAIISEQNKHCAQMLEHLDFSEREGFVAAMKKISTAVT